MPQERAGGRAEHDAPLDPRYNPAFWHGIDFWTISADLKALIERFYAIAEPDGNPPRGRYERYPVHASALLMTAADDNFWTFSQALGYYQYALVEYIGFEDKGHLLAGGCGDTNGRPRIAGTGWLEKAREFGRTVLR